MAFASSILLRSRFCWIVTLRFGIDSVFDKERISGKFSATPQAYHPDARFKGLTDRAETPVNQGEWSDIEAFLSGMSELSKAPTSLDEFADVTIRRTVELLEAIAGSVWLANEPGEFLPVCQLGATGLGEELLAIDGAHGRFLSETIEQGRSHSMAVERAGKELIRVAAPCRIDDQTVGVIEVVQPASIGEQALAGNEKLLMLVGQLTESFSRRQREREFSRTEDLYRQRETFLNRVHASLRLGPTAYRIVNEGRQLVACDRISLAVPRKDRFDIVAISGIDEIDANSEVVGSMRSLADVVAKSGQWLQFRGDTDELPPQIQSAVLEFVDLCHTHSVDVVPLETSDGDTALKTVGVLIFERHHESDDVGFEQRVGAIVSLCAGAVRNALEHESLPLLGLSRVIRSASRMIDSRGHRLITALFAVGLLASVFYFFPVRFFVHCDGNVVALSKRHVFAPLDGEVVELRCRHDQPVELGQVLMRLRSRDLEIELERSQGEYQTVEKKLLAIDLARLELLRDRAAERFPGQLAAEEQELKQRLASLLAQIQLLRKQQDQLTIRSPLSGQLMTWDPEGLLTDRPVQRGQRLLTIADLDGDWHIELDIPIHDTGHVSAVHRVSEAPIEVDFSFVNGISGVFRGELKEVARRIDVTDTNTLSMRASVTVPSEAAEFLRPGAKVRAKIHCGKRSLGFVWFHELADTVNRWLWL